jgi:Domain of unknown function (DUF1707)
MTSPNSGTTGPSQPPQAPTPAARASDADREAVVRTLHDAVARGMLSLEEGDERVAAAYATRFVDDLPRLTADLPPAPVPAPVAPGWRALAVLAFLQLRTALAGISWRAAVGSRRRLAVAAVVVLAVLSLAGMAAGELFDRGGDFGHEHEHYDND